jgi:hypothetical protein
MVLNAASTDNTFIGKIIFLKWQYFCTDRATLNHQLHFVDLSVVNRMQQCFEKIVVEVPGYFILKMTTFCFCWGQIKSTTSFQLV